MSSSFALTMAARTDQGRVRRNNEDAVFADAGLGLAMLADGMGGAQAGEVASSVLIAELAESLSRHACAGVGASSSEGEEAWCARLASEVLAANTTLYHLSQTEPCYAGMGTTLVLACFHQQYLALLHVGDSRLYRWRAGECLLLTRDHSVVQQQLDRGEISPQEALTAETRGLLTRAVGVAPWVGIDCASMLVRPGDRYLLCSDGLSDMLTMPQIGDILGQVAAADELADALVLAANAAGGRDNISVVVIDVLAARAAIGRQ